MKQIRLLIIAMAVVLLPGLCACEREDPSIGFDNKSLEMPEAGGTQTVVLTVNYPWTATTSDPWLQVSPAKGEKGTVTLSIKAEANDKGSSRKANVTVSCRDISRGVSVTQLPHLAQRLVIKHSNASFTVPSLTGSSLVGKVNWGDGQEETYKSGLKHDYASAGNHSVEIKTAGAISFKLESAAGVSELDFLNF